MAKSVEEMTLKELRESIFVQNKAEMERWNRLFKESSDEEKEVSDDEPEIEEVPEEEISAQSDEEDGTGDSVLDEIQQNLELSDTEVEILNNLIDSETDAISDYSKGLSETQNEYVRKLLTEILDDESKHLSQLKYLKSMGTDQDYVPKDDEAIDEISSILSDNPPEVEETTSEEDEPTAEEETEEDSEE